MSVPGKADELFALIKAKKSEEADRCCVACTPTSGTTVVIVDQGFLSHTVRVIDGENKGCVGDIAAEALDCDRDGRPVSGSPLGPRDTEVCIATGTGTLATQGDPKCRYEPGARLVVTDRGYFTSTVRLAESTTDCVGEVSNGILERCSDAPADVDYNDFYTRYRTGDNSTRDRLRAELLGRPISGIAELWNTKQLCLNRCGSDVVNPGASSYPDCTMFRLSSPSDPFPNGRGPISIVVPGDQRATWGPRLRLAGTKVRFESCKVLDVQDWFDFPMIICEAAEPSVRLVDTPETAAGAKDDQNRDVATPSVTQAGPSAANAVLQNAAYECAVRASAGDQGAFWESGFQLRDGRYEAPPEVSGSAVHASAGLKPEFTAVGDLWGDGRQDAVALTYDNGGGTGTSLLINVFRDVLGRANCTHAISIGDRVKVHGIRIEPPEVIVVDLTDRAAGDPSCCPSRNVERKFRLSDGGVAGYQRLPGGPWLRYRPAYWSVEARTGAAWRIVENSVWSTPAGFVVWRAIAGGAAQDASGVSEAEGLLKAQVRPRRGDRSRARGLNAEGLRLLRQEARQGEAATLLADAHAADPSDVEIANNLGFALMRVGDVEGAIEALIDAVALDPTRMHAWLNLGEALGNINLSEAASGAFRLAILGSLKSGDGERAVQRLESESSLPGVIVAARGALSDTALKLAWNPLPPDARPTMPAPSAALGGSGGSIQSGGSRSTDGASHHKPSSADTGAVTSEADVDARLFELAQRLEGIKIRKCVAIERTGIFDLATTKSLLDIARRGNEEDFNVAALHAIRFIVEVGEPVFISDAVVDGDHVGCVVQRKTDSDRGWQMPQSCKDRFACLTE